MILYLAVGSKSFLFNQHGISTDLPALAAPAPMAKVARDDSPAPSEPAVTSDQTTLGAGSVQSSASSAAASATSVVPVALGGVDLTRLFGPEHRPDITHLANGMSLDRDTRLMCSPGSCQEYVLPRKYV
jgi:hypothetical protein